MAFTGPLCRAARALVEWSRAQLAEESGVAKASIREFEGSALKLSDEDLSSLQSALERGGAVFLDEGDMGVGVRLRFTARDVRQLRRLEGEGGAVGDDDV